MLHTIIVLLSKPDGGERPVTMTSMRYLVWCQCRGHQFGGVSGSFAGTLVNDTVVDFFVVCIDPGLHAGAHISKTDANSQCGIDDPAQLHEESIAAGIQNA